MTNEKILEQARTHWDECIADPAEQRNRQEGREDARFADGEQWDERTKQIRQDAGVPCETHNRMEQILNQVENEARQNRIAINVLPIDNGIDKDTALVDEGIVRQIQRNSQSDAAIQRAFEEACRSNLGAFTLSARYCGDEDFEQELYIRHIPDAVNRCYFDSFHKEVDRSDMRYAFEVDEFSREGFKELFPEAESTKSNFFDGTTFAHDWVTQDSVRIANYWFVEITRRKLVLLASGMKGFADEIEIPKGVKPVMERIVLQRKVQCAKINGVEVLELTEWPGRSIPVYLVMGKERWVDGERRRKSVIKDAKAGQKLLNYYRSNEALLIGLTPKAPYIAAAGQIEGFEDIWNTANLVNHPVLPYTPKECGGALVPPPTRNNYEPAIQALSLAAAQTIDEIKAATGIYDASLGARSNETSGKAIAERQAQGSLANFHYIDSLRIEMDRCGRDIVEVKGKFYDTARVVQIMGKDEESRVVRVNEQYTDENGVDRHYQVADTKYNIAVTSQPSAKTQRAEAWATLVELARAYPPLMEIAGDVLFKYADIQGADIIAERFKKRLPAELVDEEDQKGQVPPQVAAQFKEMLAMIEQLTATVNEQAREIEAKVTESESRERIAAMNNQTELIIAAMKTQSDESKEEFKQEIAIIRERLQLLHADEPVSAGEAKPKAA